MKILLVDDIEAQLIRYQKAILKHNSSHEVTMARDGAEAARILSADSSFDALITDVSMPRMSGVDLVHEVCWCMEDYKSLSILVHSSEIRHSTGHEWVELGTLPKKFKNVDFHQKMFSIDPFSYIGPFLDSIKVS